MSACMQQLATTPLFHSHCGRVHAGSVDFAGQVDRHTQFLVARHWNTQLRHPAKVELRKMLPSAHQHMSLYTFIERACSSLTLSHA